MQQLRNVNNNEDMEQIIIGIIVVAVLLLAVKWSQNKKEELDQIGEYPDGFDPDGIYCHMCGEKHNPFFKCDIQLFTDDRY